MFSRSTQEMAVFQLRPQMPSEIGCVYWRTTGRPDISVLTPWHVGITSTPEIYSRRGDPQRLLSLEQHFQPLPSTFQPDPSRAWWKFKRLAQVVDQSYAARSGSVKKAWSEMERRLLKEQARIEATALPLWSSDRNAARVVLTRFCSDRALEACAQADKLAERLSTQAGQ
jgi:dipeptidase